MAIRVTQQFVQYAADPSTKSDVRCTKLFAQVGVKRGGSIVNKTASNTIFATAPTVVQDPTSPIVNADNLFGWSAGQGVAYDPVFNVFISQAIFSQEVEALYQEASNTIFASGQVASPDQYIEVVQYLGWTDRKFAPDTGNRFSLTGVVTIAVIESCSNFIFSDPAKNKVQQGYNASNSLGWVDVLSASADVYAENKFGFVDAWTFSGTFGQNINQTGGGFLRQTVSVEVSDNTCRELEYDPIIGSTDDETYEDFRVTKPVFATGTVVFTYPTTSPTNTLTLDNPDFNDGDTLHFTRIDRDTRGGDRKIYADRKWATWERLEMTVSGLCEIDAEDVFTFLNASLGKKVRFTDWQGQTWEGFIDEVGTDIVKQQDGWRLDIVFEAEVTTAFVEHNELTVTHNVNPGDDIIVTHDL